MIALLLLACGAPELTAGHLPVCGTAPNCVSSQASDEAHHIEPLPPATVAALERAVLVVPGCLVAQRNDEGLVAHCTTPSGMYTDDLVLRVEAEATQVYSASRIGWSDMGVNRERVERVRNELKALGG
jgi:uncharacterized protein (DUF1499 family)